MQEVPMMKEVEHRCWTEAAPAWRKYDARLRSAFAPVTERMLQATGVGADARVLDIACGTGEPALAAAEQVGPAGFVVATDFVAEMLAFAREKATQRGLDNVVFRRVDADELEVPAGSFDAVLVRWGIMFMSDPVGCLKRARAALRSGGRIAVACWAGRDRNAWAPEASALFAFADPALLRRAMQDAGFEDVVIEEVHVGFAADIGEPGAGSKYGWGGPGVTWIASGRK
jgi:ubiquinone/menaquinone biosynthesis C-methylase UbiE